MNIRFSVVFVIISFCAYDSVSSHRGDCECEKRKIKIVEDEETPKIKVVYSGTGCECQKALPYRIEVPVIEEQILKKHSYGVEKVEVTDPEYRYRFDTIIEKPIKYKDPKLYSYPIRVEKIEKCETIPRYIFNTRVERPTKYEDELVGLTAKLDTIVLKKPDCIQPCCKSEPENCEVCKTCKKVANVIKKCKEDDSSEEISCEDKIPLKKASCGSEKITYFSEEIDCGSSECQKCLKPNCECTKIIYEEEDDLGCDKSQNSEQVDCTKCYGDGDCEKIEFSLEETDCGCMKKYQSSSEEVNYGCERCQKARGYKQIELSSEEMDCGYMKSSAKVEKAKDSSEMKCGCTEYKCSTWKGCSEEERKSPCSSEEFVEHCGCGKPKVVYMKTRKSYRSKQTCGCD